MTRKRWEAELQAGAIGKLLGGGSTSSGAGVAGGYQEVPADVLLAQMGMGFDNA